VPERDTLKLVIVGHLDHGKSTLIGRLLHDTGSLSPEKLEEIRQVSRERGREVEYAHLMDHLQEERRDEMTIDTAQAFFRTPRRDYVIIDAPGHRELMRNMITGTSQAEAAVLVVDVCEGVREQTQRHAHFLALMGIRQVVVWINKMDKVRHDRARFEAVAEAARQYLKAVGLVPEWCIPGSALLGENVEHRAGLPGGSQDGMGWYSGPVLLEALDALRTTSRSVEGPLRFPVQDVYAVNGHKLLVGRIESGRLRAGQELLFLPSGLKSRVAAVEVFGEERSEAVSGECIGLALDSALLPSRGEVGCAGTLPTPTARFRASVFWMSGDICRKGESLLVRLSTQEIPGRVESIERRMDSASLETLEAPAERLEETELGEVVIALDRPLVAELPSSVPELGRLILTRGSETVGGGLVHEVNL
jgi:sulfate adenylyltransferase subunit 1